MNPNYRKLMIILIFTFAFSLTGCSNQAKFEKRSNTNYGSQKDSPPDIPRIYGAQQYGRPNIDPHAGLTFNKPLSDALSAMNGVNTGLVIVSDRTAYCAILIDNTAHGTRGSGSKKEINNSGTSLGRFNAHSFEQVIPSEDITTGYNDRYTVEHHKDIGHHFKQEIAKLIRQQDRSISEVYISANRDFVNYVNVLTRESRKGASLEPYVNEFNSMISHIFRE